MDVVESQACVFSVNTETVLWINRRTQHTEGCETVHHKMPSAIISLSVAMSILFNLSLLNFSSPLRMGFMGLFKVDCKLLCNTT